MSKSSEKVKKKCVDTYKWTDSQVTTAKSLGVTIDDRLDWSGHIEKVTKKVASGIGAIKRIRHLVPQATLQLIYQASIQPHFDHCNVVWGNCGITLRNKVQKLQNRAARVLTYSSYDVDAGHLFKLLGWKNLACQQQIQRATMVYRSLHGLAPNYLSAKFERREVAYNLKINSMFHYRAHTITKTPSAIVAPFSGTVFPVT